MRASRVGSLGGSGFTLVELLVVIVVLAVLVGIAGVTGGQTSRPALELAEVQVRDAFKIAPTLAFSTQSPHGVVVDLEGERLTVVRLDGSAAKHPLTHGDYIVDFTRPDQPRGLDVRSADFGDTGAVAVIDTQGVPVQAGALTLAHGKETLTLSLDAATGLLSVYSERF